MSKFLTPLCWHQTGVQQYVLDEPLVYQSDLLGLTITVPKDFQTDAESCPRWLPIINSLFGNIADEPAVVHDWLYYTAEVPRQMADKVLMEAMLIIPIPRWRCHGVYCGLRMGGWTAWNEHRKQGHPKA